MHDIKLMNSPLIGNKAPEIAHIGKKITLIKAWYVLDEDVIHASINPRFDKKNDPRNNAINNIGKFISKKFIDVSGIKDKKIIDWKTDTHVMPNAFPRTIENLPAGPTSTICKKPQFLSSINVIVENIALNNKTIDKTPG